MGILFNGWLSDATSLATARTKLAENDYISTPSGGQVAGGEVAGSCDIVTDPTDVSKYCAKIQLTQDEVDAGYPTGAKVVLFPITPSIADPITDYAGQAAARRWYRFAVLTTDWREEPRIVGTPNRPSSQLTVCWQLHDTVDTAEASWEPPLWLIDDGSGYWSLRNSYDPNAVTASGTVVRRELCKVKRVNNTWHEFVIYMKASWTSGELTVWHNGYKIFTETGIPNTYNHQPANGGDGNFIEYGIYGAKSQQVSAHTIYHKGMQIGDETYTTFNGFMAACGSSTTEKQSFPNTKVSL